MLRRGVLRAALRAAARACSGGAGAGPGAEESPLRRLLDEAGAFGEAGEGEGELQWATQPYAAGRGRGRGARAPAVAPEDTSVVLFPGQGAHRVGMGARLERVPAARDLYELASATLGWDVWRACTAGPAEELAARCQECVLVTSLAALEAAREERPGAVERARAAAGYSLGEFGALVFAGALSLEAALRVVSVRAAAMRAAAAARPGGMLTVWLAPDARLPRLLGEARAAAEAAGVARPVCAVAIDLYAGCKVLAGDEAALRHAAGAGAAHGVRRSARVAVSGAWHCALMADTEAPVGAALGAVEVRAPRLCVVSGATGLAYRSAGEVRRALARLALRPVRWEQALHGLYARPRTHAQPLTLALGPGGALRAALRQVNARAWDCSLQVDV